MDDMVGDTPCYVNFEGAISRSYAVDEDEKFLMSKIVVEDDLRRFTGILISNNHIYDDGITGMEETKVFFSDQKKEVIGLSSDHQILGVADFFNVKVATSNIINIANLNLSLVRGKIVVLHTGIMFCRLPTPTTRALVHSIAKHEPKCVILNHSHIVGASESIDGIPVHYGQGDFYMDAFGYARTISVAIDGNGRRVMFLRNRHGKISQLQLISKGWLQFKLHCYNMLLVGNARLYKVLYACVYPYSIFRYNVFTALNLFRAKGLRLGLRQMWNRRQDVLNMILWTFTDTGSRKSNLDD